MANYTIAGFFKNLSSFDKESAFIFYGAESFFIDDLLEKIVGNSFNNVSEKDLNYHKFYGTESTASEILSACMSYPMLAERKVIVVKEFERMKINKDESESFQKYLENPQTSTRLILTAVKVENKGLGKVILKNAVSVECKNLTPGDLYTWVAQKYRDHEISVEKETISFLIENIGNDLLRLNQEIEKSIAFAGETKNVTLELISELTGFNREVNIFNFQKVLGARNLKNSLKIGLQLLEQQNAIEVILAMLYRFFKQVIIVKQLHSQQMNKNDIVKKVNQTEFMLRDAFASINNFTLYELKYIFEKIEETDILLKSSERNKESMITMLCYHICTPIKNDFN